MARFFERDAGGNARQIRRFAVRDSGGTARQLRRAFVRDGSGVPRLIYQLLYSGTLIAGEDSTQSPPSFAVGYQVSLIGSLTGGGTLADGHTIVQLIDGSENNSPPLGSIQISGFSSQPPLSYFSALTINGATYLSSAATFSYLNGRAVWGWSQPFNLGNGESYSVLLS
ncbi:MAG: hypothetical protein ACREUT_22585 [Steroidobacteraceae bacterium]